MHPDNPMDSERPDNADSEKTAPDEYQQAWQSNRTNVTFDIDLLRQEVQRNQRDFRATIARRDCFEIGVALLLLPVWVYMGINNASPWTWYLTVPALVWVAGYVLVYRIRHKRDPIHSDEPIFVCVERSLTEVEDQIWLLRNIFWWYLLPLAIPLLAFTAHLSWLKSRDWLDAISDVNACVFFFLLSFFYSLYYINQRAVTKELEPRRQELWTLLDGLGDELMRERATEKNVKSVGNSRRLRRWIIVALSWLTILILIGMAGGLFDSRYDQPPQSGGPNGDSLARLIAELRAEHNLVGLAAMVMTDGQINAAAAHGERKYQSGVPVEIGDRWHLGGITKSITATMIARLVESGRMNWTDTPEAVFPKATIHETWKSVTVRQLLTHTAGAPANFSLGVRRNRLPLGPDCTNARRQAVLDVIANPNAGRPGEKYAYSNVGVTIAGAMAESATGKTWEDLVEREVFAPLKLTGAGFGPPQSPEATLDQPQGHRTFLRSKVAVGDDADNTPIMGPAATIHMTLNDLCTYATEHLRGEQGRGKLLSEDTYKLLHRPELKSYACGWIRNTLGGEGDSSRLFWHNGTNTMWYALVAFVPKENLVVAVTSNDDDWKKAESAAWRVVKANLPGDLAGSDFLQNDVFPKKSPFAAMRWSETQHDKDFPEVRLGDQWFKLVSLDGLQVEEIVAFSKNSNGDKWRKRIEEDLVELLMRMGHAPQDEVTLVVQSLASGKKIVLDDVPMTEANRWAIKASADAR